MTKEDIDRIALEYFDDKESEHEMDEIFDLAKKAIEETIKSLDQEPCEDAISRQAALDLIADYDLSMGQVVRGIHALPPVTPQPKMGRWVFVDKVQEHACCSECNYGYVDLFDGRSHNYCENCGAKMQEVEE